MITERGKVNEVGPVYSQDILASKQRKILKTGSLPELRKQSWESRDVRPAEFTRPNLLHLEHDSKNMGSGGDSEYWFRLLWA